MVFPAEGLESSSLSDIVEDPLVREAEDQKIIRSILEYVRESDDARRTRLDRSRRNRDIFFGKQDWSHKQKGQSKEHLPKSSVAVELFHAFVKRSLIQFGDWFSVDFSLGSKVPVPANRIRDLLRVFIDNLPDNHSATMTSTLALRIADSTKIALNESLMIFKVYGRHIAQDQFFVEAGQSLFDEQTGREAPGEDKLVSKQVKAWRLFIDIINPEDYYPDPSGSGLYEIHEVERDLHEVQEAAALGIYDPIEVGKLEAGFRDATKEAQRSARAAQPSQVGSFRRKVLIWEFWGTILDEDGQVLHRNVIATVANKKYLIRRPEPNPFWHSQSPFVVAPLIRVPFSVWHKALMDHAADLNIALNEMFNLMLDGGLSSVWGIKQLKSEYLIDPRSVSEGIPQGATLVIKSEVPPGEDVLKTVHSGQIPTDAMAIFEMLNREFTQAALTNEIKLGSLPAKQVRATEVIEASQNQAVILDSIATDIEHSAIEPILRKAFLTIIQFLDDADFDMVQGAIGQQATVALLGLSKAKRYVLFAKSFSFKAFGLSATLARVRDFQKTMALMQAVFANPILLRAFIKRFSEDKVLQQLMKQLNINPEYMQKNEQELAELPQALQEIAALQSMMQASRGGNAGGGGAGLAAEDVGEPALPAEINAEVQPLTRMAPNA